MAGWAKAWIAVALMVPVVAAASGSRLRSPIPERIIVDVAPYASALAALDDRERIDWQRDPVRARAITLAFAAEELRLHLRRIGIEASIERPDTSRVPAFVLATKTAIEPDPLAAQSYSIRATAHQVHVAGKTSIGVLYGVYRLLEHLGFAWDDPYDTQVPVAAGKHLRVAWPELHDVPATALRGFWIYSSSDVPDEFAVWAARNRFNLAGRMRLSMQRMLGMQGWGGEHDLLQQEFSKPGLFEAHPDWYSQINGVRRAVAAEGPYFNPAFGNSDAADYFARRMVERLEHGDLRHVDILNVWPTDARENLFDQSTAARALGNETDNMLRFLGEVSAGLKAAQADGRLSRRVTVAGASYFLTMQPPTNREVVTALQRQDYLHLFYPIDRSWAGPIDANLSHRDSNRRLLNQMAAWRRMADLRYGVVDYHNMSAYAALGLSDYGDFAENLVLMGGRRAVLFAYMHPLLRNPGPRRLTHRLMSRLLWRNRQTADNVDARAQGERLIADYFASRYGEVAREWRKVNDLMSRSVGNAKELFNTDSLYWTLFQEQLWVPATYGRAEAAAFVSRYRAGGAQDLPGKFSARVSVRETFPGLDQSILWQQQAKGRWEAVLARDLPTELRARLDHDVAWFAATASRYRLMAATCDFVLAPDASQEAANARERARREIQFLAHSPVTQDTISPVDQRAFLKHHRHLLGIARE